MNFILPVGKYVIFTCSILLIASAGHAELIEYNLTISLQELNITGAPTGAMTVNGTVPGPVLRFTEGDIARIHVRNDMDVDTSIHWHGILVPPGMDGVPNISFPPIAPNTTFTYEFPIRQSGTYWYHSHTGLQEQRGIYGAIVIDPQKTTHHVDREYVVVLSDWTDDNPHQVLRTLKRGSEWFAVEKGSAQSIFGAIRLGMFGSYLKRELQRMPPMDIADIAYDRFLANGRPEIHLDAQPGETVRLRIVDGSATTYFHLQFADAQMQIISADGIDVEPVRTKRFLIGVAETYDLLLKIPGNGSYELRATAHDGSGFASIWLGKGMRHAAPVVPKPNLYHAMGSLSLQNVFAPTPAMSMGMSDRAVGSGMFDNPGMMGMDMTSEMDHKSMSHNAPQSMDHRPVMQQHADMETKGHSSMEKPAQEMDHTMPGMVNTVENMKDMGTEHGQVITSPEDLSGRPYGRNFRPMVSDVSSADSLAMDGMDESRPWPPYAELRSPAPTAFDKDKPVREIRLTLDGDMERYVWFLNNRPLSESDSILIREGEVTRFIMINRTMMHHPMHLHGHFFRVINGQGDHAPLKHTVDVAPMSTTVIEFNANEVGDWFFHCHLLYHMKSGMARMLHYENFTAPDAVQSIRSQLYHESWYAWGEAQILSNMTEGFLRAANTRHTLSAEWEIGWQEVESSEWEGLTTWDYYFNRFFTVFAGLDLLGEGNVLDHGRGVVGFTYLLPLNIESRYWVDTDGGGRFTFEKEFALSPRLELIGEAEYDTHDSEWEGKAGLTYTFSKYISFTGQYHTDFGWGIGAVLRF